MVRHARGASSRETFRMAEGPKRAGRPRAGHDSGGEGDSLLGPKPAVKLRESIAQPLEDEADSDLGPHLGLHRRAWPAGPDVLASGAILASSNSSPA
jgi:hypothetical protein